MAEAAGLVLAVVLAILENYEDTAKGFRAFKEYSYGVRTNFKVLKIQEVIFRKANERLLCHCVDDDHAKQMLTDRQHQSWQDEQVARGYVERLGDSCSAFEDSIALISEELASLRATLNKHVASDGEPADMFKKRIKYAFRQPQIEVSLTALKDKTRDLVTLVDLTEPQQLKVNKAVHSTVTRKELERFARIKETAEDLYRALGHACTKHSNHQAHLSLEPICSDTAQIRFTIAFSQLSLTDTENDLRRPSASTWLTVESTIAGRIQSTVEAGPLLQTQTSLKRAFDEQATLPGRQQKKATRPKKCLRFQEPSSHIEPRASRTRIPPPLTNLYNNNNFCDQIRKFIEASQPSSNAVGFFEVPGESKHLVYIDSKTQTVMQSSTTSSFIDLQAALRSANPDRPSPGFALARKITLAHQLAKAVLQFHLTPWLENSWSSQEVLLSTKDVAEAEATDLKAFITAQIVGQRGTPARAESIPSPIVVRNRLLFSLGIMLLELAFHKPLVELMVEGDRDLAYSGNTEYLAAERLARQVSAHMGPRYAEVVRKCIHCDFGCGFDMKQSRLREGYYRDVVCELEKLESRMKFL
ncbi:hypothetical protein A1O3_03549 [Capronia epimyces CBS 606.96]|uniref:DUF7580 domain-containing protein n=1 Tax=Capronia epimyces CBS 606.96 TaxID=1182542 RepID=W9YBF9_9EURO|nr:uncharacterized protein A1O3_03549 [Capronia epimyces CBS 606.96]EXJ86596.1 hypothetical protein A1O3_03549 [Capronia epimyces CBS 606.96]